MKTYDPLKTRVTVAGKIISGFWEGSSVIIEPAETERYKIHNGSQGEISRSKSVIKGATLKMQLKATSPSNDDLQKVLLTLNNGFFPVSISNKSVNFVFADPEGFIVTEPPTRDLGVEETAREWAIFMPNYNAEKGILI